MRGCLKFPHITIFVHVGCEAFVEATSSALIAVSLVDWAAIFQLALGFASVDPGSMDAALEESRTTFTNSNRLKTNCQYNNIRFDG